MSKAIEIIKDHRVEDKWHRGFGRDQTFNAKGEIINVPHEEPETIVLHGTAGGSTWQGLVNWMLDGERKDLYKKGVALFHYAIDRKGTIVELISPDRWVFHSTSWLYDRFTIGIELINPDNNNMAPYLLSQYESLFYLIFDHLFKKYPISTIASHKRLGTKYSGKPKNCPGNFDYDKLESEMKNRNLSFDHDSKYESYWGIR